MIKLKDSPTKELNIFNIAKGLRENSITISGYIVGITPTYVRIKETGLENLLDIYKYRRISPSI